MTIYSNTETSLAMSGLAFSVAPCLSPDNHHNFGEGCVSDDKW